MPLRLITFDAAGTLIHVQRPVGETYSDIAKQHGIHVEAESVKTAFRKVWSSTPSPHWPEGQISPDDDRSWWMSLASNVFATALGEPVPLQTMEGLFDELYRHYEQPSAWSVYDDVRPCLEQLSEKYHLRVLSNFDRRLHSILAGHDLTRYFQRVIVSSEVGAAKPHSRMFEAAWRDLEAAPHECLHVGDDERFDVQGARDQGWQAFHVSRPGFGLDILAKKVISNAY